MTVIGIDPGTATVGYAVVSGTKKRPVIHSFGIIQTSAKQDMSLRLLEIGTDLEQVLQEFKPELALIESLFYFKNQKTVITVAQARGVLIYLSAKYNLRINELTPLQLKQALTGYGRANKAQMQQVVKKLYNLDQIPKPDDAADALAIAWCGLP
ncbi:MAG: crossover junction endodeoxyribonuclease RuvC [Patescibacteria group bacterium]